MTVTVIPCRPMPHSTFKVWNTNSTIWWQGCTREPSQSTSRNPLESPWQLSREDFTRRCKAELIPRYAAAREETSAFTEAIVQVEAEIDERVRTLYGLS